MSAFFLIAIPVVLFVLFGWVVPLSLGIRRRRNGLSGIVLIILGSVWGLIGICMIPVAVVIALAVSRVSSEDRLETFDSSKYSGETGKVTLSFKGDVDLILENTGTHRRMLFKFHNGEGRVPPGTYRINYFSGCLTDQQNVRWSASSNFPYGQNDSFSVVIGSLLNIDVGPPFCIRVLVEKKGKRSGGVHAGTDRSIQCPVYNLPNRSLIASSARFRGRV
jgi:hypothetical protein